ncbi:DUF6759 domain-containing protein [Chryseobacterium sp. SIMBA_029]|uniref:DUF6759 domain-containing protein n=1 Tax=Chryseobacterium sp. SIMBA_029 TaxID=3085772 RepID=UPI00397D7C9D
MKKLFIFSGISCILISCNANYGTYPIRTTYPSRSGSAVNNTDSEYNELIKTYKPETAEVLNDLLNSDSPGNPKTSISVENKSSCNMVLTVSGNNFFKKIPIAVGKIGYTMVPKNQNYKLSAMVCRSPYQSTQFISSSYSIKLSQ